MRGGRQALIDLELGFPGGNLLMAVGKIARPLLAPLALRTTPPLSRGARVALLIGLVGAVVALPSSCGKYRRRGAAKEKVR